MDNPKTKVCLSNVVRTFDYYCGRWIYFATYLYRGELRGIAIGFEEFV